MKSLAWHGKNDMRCDVVPDPWIARPRGAIKRIETGEIDPSFVVTHRASIEEGPELVLKP